MAAMERRLALVALWAAFAAAAVGVGFGAAGLVGGPFSDGVTDAGPSRLPSSPFSAGSSALERSSSPTPTEGTTGPESTPSRTREPTRTDGVSDTSTRPVSTRPVTRSITTRGGFVSAACRLGLIQVSGSPALGWVIEDVDGGARRDARVRFERPEGDGRVEVEATCSQGTPRFELEDDGTAAGEGKT